MFSCVYWMFKILEVILLSSSLVETARKCKIEQFPEGDKDIKEVFYLEILMLSILCGLDFGGVKFEIFLGSSSPQLPIIAGWS